MSIENEKPTLTRRKLLTLGAVGAAGTGLVIGAKVLQGGREGEKPLDPTPLSSPLPTQEPGLLQPTNEPESLVYPDDGTISYLSSLYSKETNTDFHRESFPTKEHFTDFVTKVYELAKEINPDNANLANQIIAVCNFETKGSFQASYQHESNGQAGLFGLSEETCQELGISTMQVVGMSPGEQVDVFRKLLSHRKNTASTQLVFHSVSDVWLAKSYPQHMGIAAGEILFTKGTDTYARNKDFDYWESDEITKGDIDEAIVSLALSKEESVEYVMDISRRTRSVDEVVADDAKSNQETPSDDETAKYLYKLYKKGMKDSFYDDETDALSNKRKLFFFKELTRVATRLNSDNEYLANQIAAAMFFESKQSFSSYVKNPLSDAMGLIQFMPETAHDMDTSIVRLAQLTPIEQLYYVEAFLQDKGKLWHISDVYMAIFYPGAVGKKVDFIIGNENGTKEQIANWKQNPSLVDTEHPTVITKESATKQILTSALHNGEIEEYLGYPPNYSPGS